METAQKLARTNDPQTSKDAAEKMVKSGALNRQENEVFDAILGYDKAWDDEDFTTRNIAPRMTFYTYDKAYDICRKRFSDLENKGKIELTGDRRDGC